MHRAPRKEDREGCRGKGIPLPALRAARRDAALSQRQLAERAAVSPNTVRLIETGSRGCYPSTLRKLAFALGVEPATLVRGRRPERQDRQDTQE